MNIEKYIAQKAQQASKTANNSTGVSGAVSDYVAKRAEAQKAAFDERNKNRSAERAAMEAAGDRAVLDFIKSVSQPEQPKTTQLQQVPTLSGTEKKQTVPARNAMNVTNLPGYNQPQTSDQLKREQAMIDMTAGYQKLLQTESAAKKYQEKGQQLQTQSAALEQSHKNIMALKQKYEQTGDEVSGRAYLLAVEMYNQNVNAYQKEVEIYNKESKVLADYEKAWQDLQLKQMAYQDIEDQIAAKKPENKSPEELKKMIELLDQKIIAAEHKVNPMYDIVMSYNNLGMTEQMQSKQRELEQAQADLDSLKSERETLRGYLEQRETRDWENERAEEILATGGEELMAALIDYAQEIELGQRFTFDKGVAAAAKTLKDMGVTDEQLQKWMPYARRMVSAETYEQQTGLAKELAQSSRLGEAAMSVASVPYNLTGGLGIVDVTLQKLQQKITGSDTPINYKSRGMTGHGIADAIRTGVTENIEARTEGKAGSNTALGNLHTGAYNLVMSMADSLGVVGLTAMGVPGATLLLGGSAATATMQEVKERGGTDAQALTMGWLAGAAETLFEKISLDSLIKTKSPDSWKTAIGNILKQGLTEGSEEVSTSLANSLAEEIVMGDKSQLKLMERDFMEQGMSREEAQKAAKQQWLVGILADFIGGAVSGGLFGAGDNILTADYSKSKTPKVKTEIASKPETTTRKEMDEYVQQQDLKRAESSGRIAERRASLDAESSAAEQPGAEPESGADRASEIDGYVETLRKEGKLRDTSTAALNVDGGVETDHVGIIDEENDTEEMRQIRERAREMGVDTVFTASNLTMQIGGRTYRASGEHKGGRIIVQANNKKMSMEQGANHELYHALADKDPELVNRTWEVLQTQYSQEQLDAMVEKYSRAYTDIYAQQEGMTEDQVTERIIEEMLADAYAEYGRYQGADATGLTQAVRQAAEQTENAAREQAKKDAGSAEQNAQTMAKRGKLRNIEDQSDQKIYDSLRQDETIKKLQADRDSGVITQEEYEKQIAQYVDQGTTDESIDARVREDASRFSLEGYEEELPALIEDGIQQAATMDPVRTMTGNEFAKGEKDLVTQVDEYFASVGGKAEHPILGEVALNRKGIKDDIAHGLGRKKAISFLAVPDVIAKGGMIDYQENWKGRGYDTAVVAAPVTIAGDSYMMGVVMIRSKGENRFYIHEVLTESDEGASPFKTGAVKDGEPGDDAPSVISLLQKVLDVKKSRSSFAVEEEITDNPALEEVVEGDSLTQTIKHTMGGYESFMAAQTAKIRELWNRKVDNAAKNMAKALWTDTNEEFIDAALEMAQVYMEQGTIPTKLENETFKQLYKMAPEHEGGQKAAKRAYQATVRMMMSDLNEVRRYIKAQNDAKAAKNQEDPVVEELENLWQTAKQQRRAYERAVAKNLLSDSDRILVAQLLKGETSIWKISPRKNNRRAILEVYEAKQAYEDTMRRIRFHKLARNQELIDLADSGLMMLEKWKDKKAGLLYSKSTMERNIRDIAPTPEIADKMIEMYFAPVHKNEAKSTQIKNRYRERVKQLGLKRTVQRGNALSEAAATQLLGEATENVEALKKRPADTTRDGKNMEQWQQEIVNLKETNPNMDWEKIEKAVETFRQIYDELFEMQNEVRIRNGYEPISYRRGYFPHFQRTTPDGVLASFGKAMGVIDDVTALPTTINGMTKNFRPGIRWTGHSLERKTGDTVLDALEGFDKYVEAAADVICHTDDIQRLRVLANRIRYKASDQGLRDQVDEIKMRDIPMEAKEAEIRKVYGDYQEHGRYGLSNFVVELEEYTNALANKKASGDRETERKLGRWFYNVSKAFETRVAANMVAINPASWLTNFIPLTQAWYAVDDRFMIAGLGSAILDDTKAILSHLGAKRVSTDGLVDRSTFLTNRRGADRLIQVPGAGVNKILTAPMTAIDTLVSDTVVRARYKQNLKQGLSEDAALEEADAFAASVMADRSKGALPTIFNEKNAITKTLTMFQVEQINQFEYIMKDVLKDLPKKDRKHMARFLFGAVLKILVGGWLYNEWYEKLVGRRPAFDPVGMVVDIFEAVADGKEPDKIMIEAGVDVLEQVPFIGGLLGGGRIPISSAMPDVEAILKTAWAEDKTGKEIAGDVFKELRTTLLYTLPPFGGGQAKKVWETLEAKKAHGSYSRSGELQYPVFSDDPKDEWRTLTTGLILGKSSLPEAVDWVESDFKNLSVKYTDAYKSLIETGVNDREAYEMVKAVSDAKKTETESAEVNKRKTLQELDASDESKLRLYYDVLASEREKELIYNLGEEDSSEVYNLMNAMYGAKDSVKRDMIQASGLSEAGKETAWLWTKGNAVEAQESADEKLQLAKKYGLYIGEVVEMEESGASFDTLEKLGLAGVSGDTAYTLTMNLRTAEDKNGKETDLDTVERFEIIMDSVKTENERRIAIETMLDRGDFKRMLTAKNYCTTDQYEDFLEAYQKQYKGKQMNQERVEDVLDDMKISNELKAALWQIATNGKDGKKNPYDDAIGKTIYDLVNPEEAEKETEGIMWAGR